MYSKDVDNIIASDFGETIKIGDKEVLGIYNQSHEEMDESNYMAVINSPVVVLNSNLGVIAGEITVRDQVYEIKECLDRNNGTMEVFLAKK